MAGKKQTRRQKEDWAARVDAVKTWYQSALKCRDRKADEPMGYPFCCSVCLKRMPESGKGFALHHLRYLESDRRHGDFTRVKEYYEYLADGPVVNEPERFRLLCNPCHQVVTRLRRIKSDDRIARLCRTAIDTEYG